jgi:hypothetical protein
MHNLYPLWGQGIVATCHDGGSVAIITQQGQPDAAWPSIGAQLNCHNNRLQPLYGQLWWISYDAGTFFLEELISIPAQAQ